MTDSEYITVDEAPTLLSNWEVGYSGYTFFKKGSDCNEWQAYWLDDDKLVTFVTWDNRIPMRLTRQQFEELFNE